MAFLRSATPISHGHRVYYTLQTGPDNANGKMLGRLGEYLTAATGIVEDVFTDDHAVMPPIHFLALSHTDLPTILE